MVAHAGNIESIVAQITLTVCLLRSQKNFNSVPLSYTAVYYDARFQANSYNCLSNNGFATFSKTGIKYIACLISSTLLGIIYDAHFNNNHAV